MVQLCFPSGHNHELSHVSEYYSPLVTFPQFIMPVWPTKKHGNSHHSQSSCEALQWSAKCLIARHELATREVDGIQNTGGCHCQGLVSLTSTGIVNFSALGGLRIVDVTWEIPDQNQRCHRMRVAKTHISPA
jgi:hypothetical protein